MFNVNANLFIIYYSESTRYNVLTFIYMVYANNVRVKHRKWINL